VTVFPLEELQEAEGPSVGETAPEKLVVEDDSADVAGPALPVKPSADELMKHALCHLPFRNWCAACVAARAQDDPHKSLPTKDGLPRVEIDYFFLTTKEEEEKLACF